MAQRSYFINMASSFNWGLQRLHRGRLGSQEFFRVDATSTGENVECYLMSNPINFAHIEFNSVNKGRVLHQLTSENETEFRGSALASIICGKTCGVAIDVRIHDCAVRADGRESSKNLVLSQLNQIQDDFNKNGKNRTGLVVCDWWLPLDDEVDVKIRELSGQGLLFIVGAGDEGCDAEKYTPTHLDEVITVGATNEVDQFVYGKGFSWESNYGKAVDLLAPGVEVITASDLDDLVIKFSGTSASASYVAGTLACSLETQEDSTPQSLKNQLLQVSANNLARIDAEVDELVGTAKLIAFNDNQDLKPRLEGNTSVLGVFCWGETLNEKIKFISPINEAVNVELIDFELPEGISISSEGIIQGKLEKPKDIEEDTFYFDFVIRVSNSSGFNTLELYFIVCDEKMKAQQAQQMQLVKMTKPMALHEPGHSPNMPYIMSNIH